MASHDDAKHAHDSENNKYPYLIRSLLSSSILSFVKMILDLVQISIMGEQR